MKNPLKLHTATLRDFKFVEDLARKFTNALGFIPREALNVRCARKEIEIARENDEPAGYLLSPPQLSSSPRIRPIFQAAVAMDAQRRHIGLALVERVAAAATADNKHFLQCFVRSDLESNEFFAAAGFRAVAIRTATTARGLPSILWRRQLTKAPEHSIFYLAPTAHIFGPGGRITARSDVHKQPMFVELRRRQLSPRDLCELINDGHL